MFNKYKRALLSTASIDKMVNKYLLDTSLLTDAKATIAKTDNDEHLDSTGYKITVESTETTDKMLYVSGALGDGDTAIRQLITTHTYNIPTTAYGNPGDGTNLGIFAVDGYHITYAVGVKNKEVEYRNFIPFYNLNTGAIVRHIEVNTESLSVLDATFGYDKLTLTQVNSESDIASPFTEFSMFPVGLSYYDFTDTIHRFAYASTDHMLYSRETLDNSSKHIVAIDGKTYVRCASRYSDIFFWFRIA